MGEPLQNYSAVIGAVRGMVDVRRFGLSHDHVTISTVGIVHNIRKMTADYPNLNLALSLHVRACLPVGVALVAASLRAPPVLPGWRPACGPR